MVLGQSVPEIRRFALSSVALVGTGCHPESRRGPGCHRECSAPDVILSREATKGSLSIQGSFVVSTATAVGGKRSFRSLRSLRMTLRAMRSLRMTLRAMRSLRMTPGPCARSG